VGLGCLSARFGNTRFMKSHFMSWLIVMVSL
jgi:hypothetical protein